MLNRMNKTNTTDRALTQSWHDVSFWLRMQLELATIKLLRDTVESVCTTSCATPRKTFKISLYSERNCNVHHLMTRLLQSYWLALVLMVVLQTELIWLCVATTKTHRKQCVSAKGKRMFRELEIIKYAVITRLSHHIKMVDMASGAYISSL